MTSYWLSNFCALFSSLNVIPFIGEDKNYQYNSLTRLIILVTILGYIFTEDVNIIFSGFISLILSIVFYFITFNSKSVENSVENSVESYKLETETKSDKIAAKDEIQNQFNQVSLDYTPPDTDDKRKHIYFLEGDMSASKITDVKIDTTEFLPTGPKVVNSITKNFNKLNINI
jgi:hypothetical protein|tara:strand:- start:29273 stop:29791 length:519 start_codon:yes stop_codon:yes gene_type:complete